MTDRELALCLVTGDVITPSDAIILLEGDGANRYSYAAELYLHNYAARVVFSGGVTNYAYGSFPFSDIQPLLLQAGVPDGAIVHEARSQNTREQAVEVITMALNNGWKKLILVASPEHQLRAYLTFMRELLDRYPTLILYNAPVKKLTWFSDEGWGSRFNRLELEFQRIEQYQTMGHLANYREIIEYQRWKEKQP